MKNLTLDIVKNKIHVLKELCVFLGIERSEAELQNVNTLTSIEHMKELESREDWKRMKQEKGFNSGSFVRKGKIDSFKDKIPEKLLQKFEALNSAVLNKYYRT